MPKPVLWLFCLMLLLVNPALAKPTVLFDGGLEVEVPALLRELDDVAIEQMFASSRTRPTVVFATPDSETRVSITYAASPLGAEDLDETRKVLRMKMEAGPVTFMRDENVLIHGSPWFRLDYDIDSAAGKKREVILGTSLRERLLFIVISTPFDDQELMAEDLNSVIESLRISTSPSPTLNSL